MNKSVVLKQLSKYRWELVNAKGNVMVHDLLFADSYRAALWVKAYISTWNDWAYKLEEM